LLHNAAQRMLTNCTGLLKFFCACFAVNKLNPPLVQYYLRITMYACQSLDEKLSVYNGSWDPAHPLAAPLIQVCVDPPRITALTPPAAHRCGRQRSIFAAVLRQSSRAARRCCLLAVDRRDRQTDGHRTVTLFARHYHLL